MKVWTQFEKYDKRKNKKPLILAMGNFDGVHLGHQKILQTVVENARKQGGIPAVLTFNEHPQRVLGHSEEPALLTSPQHRLFLFKDIGIEICFLIHFTTALSKFKPDEFVRIYLLEKLGAREIHFGFNARFGIDRSGNCDLMRKLSKQYGFEFFETLAVDIKGQQISSTHIRKAIREGDLEFSRKLLGRHFSLFASVVRGKGRGKTIGFPTANLKPHNEIMPPFGVYPVQVRESGFHLRPCEQEGEYDFLVEKSIPWREGVLNYGLRPTFESSSTSAVAEIFLLDYEGDLYGKTLEVVFHPRLRNEKIFENAEELSRTIQNDANNAREYFRTQAFTK